MTTDRSYSNEEISLIKIHTPHRHPGRISNYETSWISTETGHDQNCQTSLLAEFENQLDKKTQRKHDSNHDKTIC